VERERAARLDEWFAGLENQRSSVQPISPAERGLRRARAAAMLSAHGLDAFACEGGATLTYLTGVSWGASERAFLFVLLADGRHFWLCPAFEAPKAQQVLARAGLESDEPSQVVAWQEHEYAFEPLRAALAERRVERIGFDPGTRLFVVEGLRETEQAPLVSMARAFVRELRSVKDGRELELLRRANELTQRALVAVAEHVRPGHTGRDVAAMAHHAQRRLGLERTWVLALIGPAAAYPHGDEGDRPLEPGQFLLVDTGGSFHDYQSDQTRTWMPAGKPGSCETRVWNTVRDAQRRAFESVRPGVSCSQVDRRAREVIESAGYGSGYAALTHRLGHGIGLEGHEEPYFDGGSSLVLKPGMTLSDEPGIYLYGRLGVRLEDIVAVTPSGADHFGSWQADPASPA
jgi:Xaa-Pro dipeptidase